jgi:hypothetical protein
MVTEINLFEFPDLSLLELCLAGWMKSEVCKRKVDTRDELLTRLWAAVAGINKREDHLRRTARYIRLRDMQSALRRDFRTFTLNCKNFVISVQQICLLNIKLN